MMWTDLKRILRSGFVGFWRNAFVSLASTLVMALSLFIIGALIFLGAMFDTSLTQLKDKVDINVYFLTTAPESEILDLKTQVEALPEVGLVEYVNREKALAVFRERHEDDQLILQALFFYFASKARNLPLKVLYYGLALVIPILLHLGHNYLASNGFF